MFIDKSYSLAKGEVRLYCSVNVAAAGAVTLQRWNYPQMGQTGGSARTYTAAPTTGGGAFPNAAAQGAEGIFSVVRTGAGLWTVTLQDAYQRLVVLDGFGSLAGGLSAIVKVAENTSITNMNSGAPPKSVIGIALLSATANALDPASGERINLFFTLQNNTEP